MKLIKGIAALIILLLILGYVPFVSAERDSLKVIITAEDKIYKIDDTITIEVRVFNKGVPVDADEIEVMLDTHWQGSDLVVEMSLISTGVYRGSYQIQSGDHHAWFYAYVVKGTDNDGAELSIEIYQEQLQLNMHFANQGHAYVWPGQSLRATLTTRYRNDPVDVDEFTFLRLLDPSDEITDLNHTRDSTGFYTVTFQIPEMNDNGIFELEAHATYANAHAEAHAFINVNVLSVWYKLESFAGNTATFTLGVADENGDGVPNAEINIYQPQELSETTNEHGTVILSLTNIWNGIHVIGQVSGNGKNQSFDGQIFTTDPQEPPNPAHHSFDVIYEGSDYIYKPGSSVERNYKAYNSTIPLKNREIYYYITLEGMDIDIEDNYLLPVEGDHVEGASQIIKTGTVETDELGSFSIGFSAPSTQGFVYIQFECGLPKHSYNYHPQSRPTYDHDDELVYEEDWDVFFLSKGDLWNAEELEMDSDSLKVGGKTKVTIQTMESLGAEDQIIAKWMPGKPTSVMYIDQFESDWVCWVEGGNMIFLTKDGDSYKGQAIIPDFMSDEGDYTIMAGYVDGDTGYPYVNHATLKEGESIGGQKDEVVVLILLFAAIAFVLLALAFGAFVAEDKKVKKEELPSEDLIPSHSDISPLGPSSPDSSVPSEPSSPSERLSASSKFPSELEHNSTCSGYPSPENISPPEELEEVKKSEDARGGEGH